MGVFIVICKNLKKLIMYQSKKNGPLIRDESTQLFPDSEMIARKKTNQCDFEETMKGEFANKIVLACEEGVSMAAEQIRSTKPSFQNRNYKPNLVNSCIQGFLTEQYPLDSGFCKGKRYFVIVNGHQLFCKKINEKFRPSNITTKTVFMYNDQKSDNVSDTLPITYIGYQVSPSFMELLGVYAVHMLGGDIEWISNLSDLAYKNSIIEFANADHEENLDISVIPKRGVSLKKAE